MRRILFVPDVHAKYHNQRAYRAMLSFALDFKPTVICILGDFQDCYSVSSFGKDPEKNEADISVELAPGIELLNKTLDLLKPQQSFYLLGNHEHRLQRYINDQAPVVRRMFPSLKEMFGIPSKMNMIPYGDFVKFDDLAVCHGISIGRHCTSKMLDKLGVNVLHGHTHKLQMSCKTIMDRTIRAYSCGWLGDIGQIEYDQFPDYQLGFGSGYFPKSGKWDVNLHAIQNDYTVTGLGKTFEPIALKK